MKEETDIILASTSFVSNVMRHCQLHTATLILYSSVLSSCNRMTITKYCVYIVYIVCAECLFFFIIIITQKIQRAWIFLSFFLSPLLQLQCCLYKRSTLHCTSLYAALPPMSSCSRPQIRGDIKLIFFQSEQILLTFYI